MRALLAVTLVLLLPAPGAHAQPAEAAVITEWAVPWPDSRPRDPIVDTQGRVWFVGQRGDYVARLDPQSGHFERFDLKPGDGPHNVVVGPDGALWYACNTAAHIGRLDPATGAVELVAMPVARARPYGIVVAPDGTPWVAAFGTNRLVAVDPEALALRDYVLPREEARPRRLAATSDGTVWYVDYAGGHLGRLDPATGEVEEWALPGGAGARPYAMAADDRDRLWFFETGANPNRLIGFDPSTGLFIEGPAPESGGGTVRHMVYDAASGALWFGTDTNTIGRATLR